MTRDYTTEDRERIYEELDFTDDFIFCKVLTHNPDVCEELLTLILGREVKLVETEKQVPIDITSDGHGVRFDVYSTDDSGNRYDIEMQVAKKPEIAKRSRYYQSMIDLDMLEKGMSYRELKDGYVIFICTFDPFSAGIPRYSYESMCEEIPGNRLNDGTHKIFLNTIAAKGEMSVELRALFEYINSREPRDSLTRKLDELVVKARKNKEWRLEYMTLLERDRENREAGKAEGIKEGRKQGLEAGKAEGIKEGRKQGLEAGKAEGLKEGIEQGIEKGRSHLIEQLLSGEVSIEDLRTELAASASSVSDD